MADCGIQIRNLWLPNCNDIHAYVLYKTPTVLQTILRMMGKIRRKKAPTAEFNIFLSNFFSTEINKKTKTHPNSGALFLLKSAD